MLLQEASVHVPFDVLHDIVRACVIEPIWPLGQATLWVEDGAAGQAIGAGAQLLVVLLQEPSVHVPLDVLHDIVRACVIEPICPLGHETV